MSGSASSGSLAAETGAGSIAKPSLALIKVLGDGNCTYNAIAVMIQLGYFLMRDHANWAREHVFIFDSPLMGEILTELETNLGISTEQKNNPPLFDRYSHIFTTELEPLPFRERQECVTKALRRVAMKPFALSQNARSLTEKQTFLIASVTDTDSQYGKEKAAKDNQVKNGYMSQAEADAAMEIMFPGWKQHLDEIQRLADEEIALRRNKQVDISDNKKAQADERLKFYPKVYEYYGTNNIWPDASIYTPLIEGLLFPILKNDLPYFTQENLSMLAEEVDGKFWGILHNSSGAHFNVAAPTWIVEQHDAEMGEGFKFDIKTPGWREAPAFSSASEGSDAIFSKLPPTTFSKPFSQLNPLPFTTLKIKDIEASLSTSLNASFPLMNNDSPCWIHNNNDFYQNGSITLLTYHYFQPAGGILEIESATLTVQKNDAEDAIDVALTAKPDHIKLDTQAEALAKVFYVSWIKAGKASFSLENISDPNLMPLIVKAMFDLVKAHDDEASPTELRDSIREVKAIGSPPMSKNEIENLCNGAQVQKVLKNKVC